MSRKKKEEEQAPGSPAWMATFSDLMNLLLCFFVLLFSMSEIDVDKWQQVAMSFSENFSIFSGGATAIGDGFLISNGVSQLNELDDYINSTGKTAESEEFVNDLEEFEEKQLAAAEQLAEEIEESVEESQFANEIDVDFTAQYVSLTLNGALLFDSGSAELKEEAKPLMDKIGQLLGRYAQSTIEIEGHTDNVPIHNARFADNNELSSFRALSVFNYFMETTFLDPAMIKHSGRGEYLPVADNGTPEGRAQNRRVEIKIYHSLSVGE